MEEVKLPIHRHPLLPITRFSDNRCKGCNEWGFSRYCGDRFTFQLYFHESYIYGGYRCNELGCEAVFHRECAESLPEINHSSHPHHPLKLLISDTLSTCSRCGIQFQNGYICSICDFKLDLRCAKGTIDILENSNLHHHPLELFPSMGKSDCKICDSPVSKNDLCYRCHPCEFVFHVECAKFFPEANHISHSQHPLQYLALEAVSDYAEEKCLLCRITFDYGNYKLHHCYVCNFSICTACMAVPPPIRLESPTTHEHQLHLVPRLINFTCNACGTLGDRSPYFCLQCNFMIHWQCIDLPRIININRHDHRITYNRRLGHGEWKCKVCREKVNGFYGAYTCIKCPTLAVHSLCATRQDVWDMIELEGMPEEEEEIAPFKVIDDNTILHFSHDHNLQINNNIHGLILPDNIVCEACCLQIISEPFYSCKQCNFTLHEKCANHSRKKRHVINNLPFTLLTDSRDEVDRCGICYQFFTGFRYRSNNANSGDVIIDVRCAAVSDTLEHGSHQHPLYYCTAPNDFNPCSRCDKESDGFYRCDKCDYTLDGKCAHLPKKVMKNRYDDHPLFLSFGDMDVDSVYWCEACEKKVNPKEWFYTCNDCGTILHISCVVGEFSFIIRGSVSSVIKGYHGTSSNNEVVSNTSSCRPFCSGPCNSLCNLTSVLKISTASVDVYFCSFTCYFEHFFSIREDLI